MAYSNVIFKASSNTAVRIDLLSTTYSNFGLDVLFFWVDMFGSLHSIASKHDQFNVFEKENVPYF